MFTLRQSKRGQTRKAGGRNGKAMGRSDKIVSFGADLGSGVRMQYGALCWRESENGLEVLLITSRDTGRWVIPKGWPIAGLAPEDAAAKEAWEEAGVKGVTNPVCLGRFGYLKVLGQTAQVPCAVSVYGMQVARLADKFPEVDERRRAWFPPAVAAGLVNEPDLARLIAGFTPPPAGRPGPIAGE